MRKTIVAHDSELFGMLVADLEKMPVDEARGPAAPVSAHYYLLKHERTGRCIVVDHTNIGNPPKVPPGWRVKWDSDDRGVVESKFNELCRPSGGRC